jgi:hypothetical protein
MYLVGPSFSSALCVASQHSVDLKGRQLRDKSEDRSVVGDVGVVGDDDVFTKTNPPNSGRSEAP